MWPNIYENCKVAQFISDTVGNNENSIYSCQENTQVLSLKCNLQMHC